MDQTFWASTAAASSSLSDPEALLLRAVVVQARADARLAGGRDAAAFLEALGTPDRRRLPAPADWPARLEEFAYRQVPLRVALDLLGVTWAQYKAQCITDPGLSGRLMAARRAYRHGAPADAARVRALGELAV